MASQPEAKVFHMDGYPTVLVAHHDVGVRGTLLDCLQRNGFHVLEADRAHIFDVVRVHSRPIHLLLADVSMDAHVVMPQDIFPPRVPAFSS